MVIFYRLGPENNEFGNSAGADCSALLVLQKYIPPSVGAQPTGCWGLEMHGPCVYTFEGVSPKNGVCPSELEH